MYFLSVKAIKESNATMCIQLISAYGLFARSQQRCEQVRTCELEYIPYHRFVHMLKLIINFFSHFHFFLR